MSFDGGINHLANWAGNQIMPCLAGLFFAGAVYRIGSGGDHKRLVYGGVATLVGAGSLRTLEAFVTRAGPTKEEGFSLALVAFVSYVGNVILPIYAVTLFLDMAIHMGGVLTEIYPGSVFIRKGIAAMGAMLISAFVRRAEYFVTHAHGIPVGIPHGT